MNNKQHGASEAQVDNPPKAETVIRHQLPLQPSPRNEGEWFSAK